MQESAIKSATMDIWQLWPFISAVILGNAVSFFFFMAAMKMSRLQKDGVQGDELPWWVYLGLFLAPAVMAVGISLLK